MNPARRPAQLAALAALVAVAAAVPASAVSSPARNTRGASLCSVAKGVAKTLERPPTAASLTTAQAQAQLKTNLGRVLAARNRLVGASPGSLKPAMRQVLAVFALLRSDLSAANWSFAVLASKPAVLSKLEATLGKSKRSFNRVGGYLRTTCHL